jgi:hypothetical protein
MTTSGFQDVMLAVIGFSTVGCSAKELCDRLAPVNVQVRDRIIRECHSLRDKNLLTWDGPDIEEDTVLRRL